MLNIIPWTLFIILYMVIVHALGLDMSGVLGYIFLGLCMVILFMEFFKSGDIHVTTFLIDLITSVVALVVATALISYLVLSKGQMPTFFDWFGAVVLLGDAILSPFNSFRTALRNVEFGGGGGA